MPVNLQHYDQALYYPNAPNENLDTRAVIKVLKFNTDTKLTDLVEFVNTKSQAWRAAGLQGHINVTIYDGPAHPFTTRMEAIGNHIDTDENDYVASWVLDSWYEYAELAPVKKKMEDLKLVQYFNNPNAKSKNFSINIYLREDRAGHTTDKYNNCLAKAIRDVIPTKFDKEFASFKAFKTAFGVGVADPFPLDKIEEVEERLRVNLPIQGDLVKMSKQLHKLTIPLLFINGHITLNKQEIQTKTIKNISYKDRRPLITCFDFKKQLYICYDGETETTKTLAEIKDILNNPLSSDYIIIKERYQAYLKETYDEFTTEAAKLKEITNGKINMFRTGYIKDTIIKLFYDSIKATFSSQPIQQDEAHWIINSKRCGLVFGDKYKGQLHKYDYSSYYGSILRGISDFPVRRGEFKTIKHDEIIQIVRYGIYRCIITSDNPQAYKTFRFNKLNYYTHIDVKFAKKNNFNVQLIEDGYPNFLYYSDECRVKGSQLFRDVVDYVFDIKKKYPKLSFPKRLLSNLGGALAEFKINKKYLLPNTAPEPSGRPQIIKHMSFFGTNKIKLETLDVNDQFKTEYARMYPFMTAQGRCKIGQLFFDNGVENIKRVHTDGFCSLIKIPDCKNKADCNIGELGYEETANYEVVNSMKIIKLK